METPKLGKTSPILPQGVFCFRDIKISLDRCIHTCLWHGPHDEGTRPLSKLNEAGVRQLLMRNSQSRHKKSSIIKKKHAYQELWRQFPSCCCFSDHLCRLTQHRPRSLVRSLLTHMCTHTVVIRESLCIDPEIFICVAQTKNRGSSLAFCSVWLC